jgi:uridine monophosphate synthetase
MFFSLSIFGIGAQIEPIYQPSNFTTVQKELLFTRLYQIGALKFGSFKLKSGQISPIYFDLRVIVSYPDVLQQIADCMWKKLEGSLIKFDCICGVPYTALPIATAISLFHDKPMIMKRKEAKDYGTKKVLEGVFSPADTCLIVEDVITTGGSILETIEALEQEKIKVNHVIVCIDREQGGVKNVQQKGYTITALYTVSEILSFARNSGYITDEQYEDIQLYFRQN